MPRVMRTQIDVVLDDGVGVLNGADARVAELAGLCDGEVILYAADPQAPALAAHLAGGHRGASVRGERIVLLRGATHTPCADLAAFRRRMAPTGLPDNAATDVLLAAVAAAWALDLPPDLITAGVETFHPAA
jgi:cyanophycin synthetase